MNISLHFHL